MLIDDEEMVITSVRAYLALETNYHVQGFTDPEMAAEHMKSNPFDVVVSDYLMPKINGIELLRRARETAPEASRILLTGHSDKQSAVDAINTVALFQYIEKPWDNQQLLLAIQGGVERTRLLRDLKDVQKKLLRAFL
ncbi:MAG TPA: response regulator [Bryobacteraceae bacterium]|nr:response regulator [Bryobacteraceae bacterium]